MARPPAYGGCTGEGGRLGGALQSSLVQTVLLGAALLGAVAGMLGAFALLRRQSLLGDTLSHAALPGICIGFLIAGGRDLGAILLGALASGALAALAVSLIARRTRLKPDAALALVLALFFAAGIVLLTWLQGRGGAGQAGLSSFLFGEAAAIRPGDLWLIGAVAGGALLAVLAFWKEFKLISFDPVSARAIGLPVGALEAGLTLLTALVIVAGLQMVGVVLMVALLVAPAAAARQWARGLGAMVALAAVFGAAAGVAGALASAQTRGLPTGPAVVLVATAIVIVSLLAAPGRGLVARALAARRARRALSGDRILVSMNRLGADHGDPGWPVEAGMLDALHGARTGAAMAGLEARGLVRAASHPPETTAHWELTEAGRRAAVRIEGGLAGDSMTGDGPTGNGATGDAAAGMGAIDAGAGKGGKNGDGAVARDAGRADKAPGGRGAEGAAGPEGER